MCVYVCELLTAGTVSSAFVRICSKLSKLSLFADITCSPLTNKSETQNYSIL